MSTDCKVSVIAPLRWSVEEVWPLVADFANTEAWLPGGRVVRVEGASSDVGMLRHVETAIGLFIERLDSLDAERHRIGYSIVESPWPIERYSASVQISATPDGCSLEWSGDFAPTESTPADFEKTLEHMYSRFIAKLGRTLAAAKP